ncbi:MAG: hypothetical protein ABIO67_00890 [Mycobacteriales bacterium]
MSVSLRALPRPALVLVTALASLVAMLAGPGAPSAHAEGTYNIGGVINAIDGRAVNALIGIDLQDASGQALDRNGCVRSSACPIPSYGVVVNVNRTLPPEGSADTSTATIRWNATIPANTANVYIEVYPKNEKGVTTETRYGHAMRHNVQTPTFDDIDLRLPLICSAGGDTGEVSGQATKNGAPITLTRAIAWSIDRYDPVGRPTLGWNVGTVGTDGTYVVPNLPPNQRYQVWTTTSEGERHKEIGVSVNPCATTVSDVDFTPPAPSPNPSGSPAPPTPPAPTLENGSALIRTGMSASMGGAADPGQTVELLAYSRPSTDYRVVRTTTASSSGAYTFVVAPQTNTRLKVRIAGQESDSIVVSVSPWISLRTVQTAARTFTMTGQVRPIRPGQLVTVFAMTPTGPVRVGRGSVDGSGVWEASHRFTVAGTYPLFAATTGDLTNAEGRSPDGRLTIG